MPGAYEEVYDLVRRIPHGKVLTYGLLSNLLNGRLSAQGVGWALHSLANRPGTAPELGQRRLRANKTEALEGRPPVPWHRVVNSRGGISTHKNPDLAPGIQKMLLEREGIVFGPGECLSLERYLWKQGLNES